MAKEKGIDKLSYEQAFEELEGIVDALEGEIKDLDQALSLFERGQALSKHCAELLEKAELKVQQLTDNGELQELD
jgi:exodeoxyribonuclease VII small subunit